jgi:flagellar motor switch protein FliN
LRESERQLESILDHAAEGMIVLSATGAIERFNREAQQMFGYSGQEIRGLHLKQITVELGRTRIPIRNLLQLNQGSVVELDRAAGEPLDVFVNGTLVAHGEVVVVNEKFGIRITDVVSPAERIRKLK